MEVTSFYMVTLSWLNILKLVLTLGVLAYGIWHLVNRRPGNPLLLTFWITLGLVVLVGAGFVLAYFAGKGGVSEGEYFAISSLANPAFNFLLFLWLPIVLIGGLVHKFSNKEKVLMPQNLMIAIDGPAAAGKGTLSRKLATHFNLPHLDTGLTYRAVGYYMLEHDLPLDDEAVAAKAAMDVDLGSLDRTKLAQHHVGEAASKVAVMPTVRKALVDAQRNFAKSGQGAVLDGRDIGTVVLTDADVKLYVTASAETRAKRRHDEIIERFKSKEDDAPDYQQILADINERDERDMGRADSPLKPAEDAILIDTSKMDIEQAFSNALEAIAAKLNV